LCEQADGESKDDESDSPDCLDSHVIQSMFDAVEMELLKPSALDGVRTGLNGLACFDDHFTKCPTDSGLIDFVH
jgi:hypothetical protein